MRISFILCVIRTHLPTRFVKINAEKSPFFVGKLQIKVLPTIVLFKDGIAIDRIIGFEELGGSDEFPTSAMEKRLAQAAVILREEQEDDGPQLEANIRASRLNAMLADDDE